MQDAHTLSYPAEFKYSKSHEYVKVDGNKARIGITAFAADQLGDVTYVELPEVGAHLHKDGKFGVIESVKSVSDLFCPISGKVLSINEKLAEEPELVNSDCYGAGWMLEVEMSNPSELDLILTVDTYKQFIVE
jgi:glycine cleavage system H protein